MIGSVSGALTLVCAVCRVKNLICRNGYYWLCSRRMHYFIVRPILITVSRIFLKLRHIFKLGIALFFGLLKAQSFYLLIPTILLLLVIFRDNVPICSLHWDNSIDCENQMCLFSPLFLLSFQFKLGSWAPPLWMMKWRVMLYFAPERNVVKLL